MRVLEKLTGMACIEYQPCGSSETNLRSSFSPRTTKISLVYIFDEKKNKKLDIGGAT